jgi:hypothetical protein
MTTFTTEDRINASPPHIVDSGASVMGMTANELADHLKKYFDSEPYCDEVVTMLRQQQAEIGCYKIELELHKAMIQDLEKGLDSSIKLNKAQAERNNEQ